MFSLTLLCDHKLTVQCKSAGLGALKKEENDLQRKKKQLEQRINELTQWLEADYGVEREFLPLKDKCFNAKVEKYTYEVCPFKDAKQKEGHGSTQLGKWSGFTDNYHGMSFTNGQHCWQGPNRSLQVKLACGEEEEVSKIEEPSRCEYVGVFVTPAACSASFVAHSLKVYEEAEAAAQLASMHEEL